jgi:hypothetical protein
MRTESGRPSTSHPLGRSISVSVSTRAGTDPPRYLLRDRDKIYGQAFRKRVTGIGLEEVLTAARSPWQNPYVERLIGTIRRDCLDHVVVFQEGHLRRMLSAYFDYDSPGASSSVAGDGLPGTS